MKNDGEGKGRNMNEVKIVGELLLNPETKTTANGKQVLETLIKVPGWQGREDIIPCAVFGKSIDTFKPLSRGDTVEIKGRLGSREKATRTGEKYYTVQFYGVSAQVVAGAKEKPAPVSEEIPF